MYAVYNFKTKKEFKAAVTAFRAGKGPAVRIFDNSPFCNDPLDIKDGEYMVEGPHYPKPHTWWSNVTVVNGAVVKVV